jgi:hypothetical protein
MVEVFKTNVEDPGQANKLIDRIHKIFVNYKVNFDLEDCDKIMRVECAEELIHTSELIDLLRNSGFKAEILSDTNANETVG